METAFIRDQGDAVVIDVLVQPRASRARVGPVHGDRIKVSVTAPPVDGKANAAVIALLSKLLSVPKRSLEVTAGHASRRKTVRVTGLAIDAVKTALGVTHDA